MKSNLIFIMLILSLNGCAVLGIEPQALRTLKDFNASRKDQEKEIALAEKRFRALLEDALTGHLEKGMRKSSIIAKYGEPIAHYNLQTGQVREIFSYRRPCQFFGSDKVYLYFDQNYRLVDYKIIENQ